ncbi:hypothetical protein CLOP_g17585, partial [Closterium sp. NIES-67]
LRFPLPASLLLPLPSSCFALPTSRFSPLPAQSIFLVPASRPSPCRCSLFHSSCFMRRIPAASRCFLLPASCSPLPASLETLFPASRFPRPAARGQPLPKFQATQSQTNGAPPA